MRALLDGRLEQADELAAHALAAGGTAEAVTATQYYAIQLFLVREEQGRVGEVEAAAREFVARYPAVPAWRAGLGRLLLATGRAGEARDELETLAARDFEDLPRDGNWMIAITLLGELCAELGDAKRAARLYELLLPFAELNVVIGLGVVCFGAAARQLGRLAATTGRHEDAIEHFERALAGNAALKAPLWLAHTQLDYARALGGGKRASKLIDAATATAAELDLPAIAGRVAGLRG
jgi:tetratricopeptide (TPR) repeat protein